MFASVLCGAFQLFESWLTHLDWKLNDNLDVYIFGESIWWNLKSVLFEEFIFRGALLFIAVERLGVKKGVLLSGAAFGIYHWFSFGVIGNPIAMTVVFGATGLMGLAWAYSFTATKSMALPIGLHFGWNYVTNSVFSKGPIGDQILIAVKGENYAELTGLINLLNFVLPIIITALLTYGLACRLRENESKAKTIAS